MIGRVIASAAAVTPVAAAALEKAKGAAVQEPVVWYFLGLPFQAAGMVAALFACGAARWWVGAAASIRKEHRWSLDVPVTAMALATAGGLAMKLSPEPISGLLLGAGVGVIGEGIFKIAERQLKASGVLGAPEPAPRPTDPATAAGIGQALRDAHPPIEGELP